KGAGQGCRLPARGRGWKRGRGRRRRRGDPGRDRAWPFDKRAGAAFGDPTSAGSPGAAPLHRAAHHSRAACPGQTGIGGPIDQVPGGGGAVTRSPPRGVGAFFSPAAEAVLKEKFFGAQRGFFVAVGANEPQADSQTWQLEQTGWTGVLIEP